MTVLASSKLKTWAAAFWPFAALFLLFLWPLLLLKKSFILGDYGVQHFPWAAATYDAVHNGRLPLWTNGMASGFPLFAEGQCAAIYFLHLIFYKTLPFLAAYTWGIPFHMLAGGVSFYLYVRALGVGREAAVLGIVVFCFSSTYAGCFYTPGSLRALCWMPLALWMLERVRAGDGRRVAVYGAALAFLISQQWCAGYPQLAVYSFGYYLFHELLAKNKRRTLPLLAASLVAGTALAWPQVSATLELARYSVRSDTNLAFALWGSAPPIAPVSLLFPEWGNTLRYSFYVGILPFFFVCASFFLKKPEAWRRHALLAVIFLLLALGQFNPVYQWMIQALHLTSMRVPAKFLFFSATSLAVLATFGYDALMRERAASEASSRTARCARFLAVVTVLLPLAALALVRLLERFQSLFSQWYVSGLISGKGAEAKDPSYYLSILTAFFRSLPGLFSYTHWSNLQAIALAIAAAGLLSIRAKRGLSTGKMHAAVSFLLVWDLWVYGLFLGSGFIGNAGPIERLLPTAPMARVQQAVTRSPGALVELVREPKNELFYPNSSMTYSIQHAGGYSPLLIKSYETLVQDLGITDASLGRRPLSEEVWRSQRAILDLIGARYIHSDFPLAWEGLKQVGGEGDFYLYENERALRAVEAFYRWRTLADPAERLAWMKSGDYRASEEAVLQDASDAEGLLPKAAAKEPEFYFTKDNDSDALGLFLTMPSDGVVMLRTTAYPGWSLKVDGQAQRWFTVNHAFIGFALKEGKHEIALSYRPTSWLWAWRVCFLAAAVLALAVLIQFLSTRGYNRRP